jgi:hypothetical protein
MNVQSQWFPWTASDGNLDITLNGGKSPIGAVWLPVVQFGLNVSFYNGASLFYATSEQGPETVTMPDQLFAVTLEGANTNQVYVFATSLPLPPSKEIDLSGLSTGGRLTDVAADGSATTAVTIPSGTIAAISLTAGVNGGLPSPAPTLVADYCNPSNGGFDVFVTGGAAGTTCYVDWTVFYQ